ncbi:MAG: tyrosine-type recombinase/integrase [Bacteroidales bacterium]
MATISVVYRKDKMNKDGEAPINFRIIKDRKVSYVSTGIKLPEDQWDFKKNCVKPKHPNSKRLNSFLTNKFNETQEQVFEHETIQKSLTTRQLRDKVYGKKPTDFFTFADQVIADYLKDGRIGTHDKNKSVMEKLKTYAGNRNLSFQDITVEFLEKYEDYLKSELSNCTNTVAKDFKFFRKLFNDAYGKDLIEHQINPFNKYKIKLEKTERTYLTEDELTLIEAFEATAGTKMERHRDMFVFAAYSGGLRVSDLLQLRWKDFDGHYIHFTTKKTDNQMSIKVPNKGLAIINKYKPAVVVPDGFIFGLLPENLDTSDLRALDTAISRATAYYNKNLKTIAEKKGINKPVSSHISRHTFATRALRKGISIDKVSKLLGHADISETQIYAKIVSSELDKAMDIFNE